MTSTSKKTIIGPQQFSKLPKCLNSYNFQFVQSLCINAPVDDFFALYEKILKLWDSCPDHCIRFNAANANVYLFPRFISQDSVHYTELEDSELVVTERHKKMNNLINWNIGDVTELKYMPFNPNLEELELNSKASSLSPYTLNERCLKNINQIDTLILSLNDDINSLFNLKLERPLTNLKSLSLTNVHSLKKHLILTTYKLASFVDISQLEHLKLNVSCSNHCHCIAHLLSDIASHAINLKTLSVSSNVKDLESFRLIASSLRHLKALESLELCLDELGLQKDHRFNFKMLATSLSSLDDLKRVEIGDIHHYTVPGSLCIGAVPVIVK